MSLYLKEFEACKFAKTCPYNSTYESCQGASDNRKTKFVCDLVTESGSFKEGGFRNKNDSTGQMKLLLE